MEKEKERCFLHANEGGREIKKRMDCGGMVGSIKKKKEEEEGSRVLTIRACGEY